MSTEADIDFSGLYDTHRTPIFNYLRKLTGDEELAEDLTQETFLAVHRYSGSYSGEKGSLNTWLGTIARNTFYRHLKKTRTDTSQLPDDIPDESMNPLFDEAEIKEKQEIIRKAVESLPELERKVISGKFFEKLTLRQCAERLNVSESTVSRRLLDAYKLLTAELKREGVSL